MPIICCEFVEVRKNTNNFKSLLPPRAFKKPTDIFEDEFLYYMTDYRSGYIIMGSE